MVAEGNTLDRYFLTLKNEIFKQTSLDCNQYKDSYLKRRFAVRMRSRGVDNYNDYIHLLSKDPTEYDELMRDITINVTQFFRDRAVFKALEEEILPLLIYDKVQRGQRTLRVWSAGCSSGEEPYSLAIMFKELLGEDMDDYAVSVIGTDIDEGSLETAEAGYYLPRQIVNVPPDHLSKYFEFDGELYHVVPEIREMVRFRNLDLFSGTAGSNFDLILCRNVVIYFNKEMQEKLYMKFFSSMADGGYFIMGNTETLIGEAQHMFISVKTRERIYQKPCKK